MTVVIKRKQSKACSSPVEVRKRRKDIILPPGFEKLLGSVEALRSRLNAVKDTQTLHFDTIFEDLSLLESEMMAARDRLIIPRIKSVCADVLLFAIGVNPNKNCKRSYFSAKRTDRRIASKISALLECPCFAGRKRSELAADFDSVISNGLSNDFHLQNKADLVAEVNLCLRAFAERPALQNVVSLQYRILKEFVHISSLL